MNPILSIVNGLASGLLGLLLVGMVLHPAVCDRIVIKSGLICAAAGLGALGLLLLGGVSADELVGLERSLLLINLGLLVVVLGYLLRRHQARHELRRSTDWADFDPRPVAPGRFPSVSGGKKG